MPTGRQLEPNAHSPSFPAACSFSPFAVSTLSRPGEDTRRRPRDSPYSPSGECVKSSEWSDDETRRLLFFSADGPSCKEAARLSNHKADRTWAREVGLGGAVQRVRMLFTHLFRSSIHAESTSLAIRTSLLPDPAAAAVRVEQQGRSAIEGRESESEEVARLLVWVEGKERRDGNGQAVCYRVHRPGRQGENFNKRTRLSHAHRPTVGAKRSLSLFSCCSSFSPVRSKHPLATRRGHSAAPIPTSPSGECVKSSEWSDDETRRLLFFLRRRTVVQGGRAALQPQSGQNAGQREAGLGGAVQRVRMLFTHLFRSSIHAESPSLAIGTSLLPDPAAAAVRVEQQGRSAIEGRESESEEVARLLVWVEGKERRDGNGQAVCYRVHRPGRQGENFNKRTRLSHAHRPTVGAKRSLSLFSCCLSFSPFAVSTLSRPGEDTRRRPSPRRRVASVSRVVSGRTTRRDDFFFSADGPSCKEAAALSNHKADRTRARERLDSVRRAARANVIHSFVPQQHTR